MFRHVRKLFETRVAVEIEIDVNKVVLLTWVPCLQQKLCLSLKRRCYFLCKREKVRSIRVIENAWLLWWCFLGDDRYPRDRFFRSKTHKAFARWILNFHKILSPRLKITIIFTVWQREEWLENISLCLLEPPRWTERYVKLARLFAPRLKDHTENCSLWNPR